MSLKDLVLDPNEIEERELEPLLKGRVTFDPSDMRPRVTVAELKFLSPEGKILLSLAGFRGSEILGTKTVNTTPKLLEEVTRLKGGTLRPSLRKLLDDGFVGYSKDRGYFLLPMGIDRLQTIIKTKKEV